jgi:hypothetical protein
VKQSDSGRSCTSIVTEYHQKKLDQDAPFMVEVEYLDATTMKEHLRELLWSYRRIYLPEIDANHLSDMDFKKYESESDIAWSTLHTAFRHESELTPAFAQDMSDGADVRILNKLVEWAGRVKWPQGSVAGYWTTTALTVKECAKKTRPFMEDRFWPFTKIIRSVSCPFFSFSFFFFPFIFFFVCDLD